MYLDYLTVDSTITGVEAIKQSINNILMTPKGSMPGNPRFGSYLYKVLFSQLDPLTETFIKNYVNEALTEFEPRINVISVTPKMIPEFNRVVIEILFSYKDASLRTNSTETNTSISLGINL